ncbi:Ger(x)C family spore germination protein [Paenibacillus qinlingensis]|uniref:Ger(x)C family spore germination protein n=1 Tax=Paenibacillus qinlingensis TaxID=1837343 RepID=UPI00156416DB|nr:Ger(x)C family spore germination protein [Paenibacillus qinlingensis]NQX62234.1 Ger(x)C family spore germination protein [Paenibacillus qinlingensis]
MIRVVFQTCMLLFLLMLLTSCTDFVEPNQLAFVMGTAIDHAENGNMEVSYQIAIPSKMNTYKSGSSDSDSFIVISAIGKDVFEATQKVQREMSRRLMTSHRILIAISEEFFNKNDVSQLFDKLGRDPANNQRDVTIMIKGNNAKEFLMIKHPMENISSIAAGKELHINGLKSFSTRQFIIDSVTQETCSLVPILQIKNVKVNTQKAGPIALLSGYAVINKKLKVDGALDNSEGEDVAWLSGKGSSIGVTIPWKDGNGVLSFRLTHLGRHIQSVRSHDPRQVVITVKAQAYLLENTTSLDMSEVANMSEVKKYLNEQIQSRLQLALGKVQQWGPDVFGIGAYLHRKYPYWWKAQRNDWDENFKKVEVHVQANIQLRSVGVIGAQLE